MPAKPTEIPFFSLENAIFFFVLFTKHLIAVLTNTGALFSVLCIIVCWLPCWWIKCNEHLTNAKSSTDLLHLCGYQKEGDHTHTYTIAAYTIHAGAFLFLPLNCLWKIVIFRIGSCEMWEMGTASEWVSVSVKPVGWNRNHHCLTSSIIYCW